MKEHGTLFKGEMVRAILARIKNQTRRPITRRNSLVDGAPASATLWDSLDFDHPDVFVDAGPSPAGNAGPYMKVPRPSEGTVHRVYPRMQPGDRMWVRETFQPLYAEGFDHYTVDWQTGKGYSIRYVATDGVREWIDGDDNITDRCKPGIHMPRWACRLVLDVPSVRCERLQSISEADAKAEGSPLVSGSYSHRGWYRELWGEINGAGDWARNRHVWIYNFKVTP